MLIYSAFLFCVLLVFRLFF